MHSASSRFNSITLYAGLVMAIMCAINYAHGRYLYNPNVDVKFQITQLPNFMKTPSWEVASFRYNLEADLSSLYTWNLKQLYVYIQVQFSHPQKKLNSRQIVYDWIISVPEDKSQLQKQFLLKVQNKPLQYSIRDIHNGLLGNTLKISLNVEYMPQVGIFSKTRLFQTNYTLPDQYRKPVNA